MTIYKTLSEDYKARLEQIKEDIQASEELATFLAEEEQEDYMRLQEKFEKEINALYEEVAAQDPLQLFDLEDHLIDSQFEGLFFPRLLGYSVLRGEINDQYKYVRPQEHFKKILLAICESFYFDIVKQRMGQAVQIGFALSSDIWITNLLEEIQNKNIKQFLQSQKIDKYRAVQQRSAGYHRFKRQFQTTNFQSTEFPTNATEMTVWFGSLKKFLEYRIQTNANHDSYREELLGLLENEALKGKDAYIHILGLIANFIAMEGDSKKRMAKAFNDQRSKNDKFNQQYFEFLNDLIDSTLPFQSDCDALVFDILDENIEDDILHYYSALNVVAQKGFVHEDSKEAVRQLYARYDGLSLINNCLRMTILNQFVRVLRNLTEAEYPDYFELNKTFVAYMDIFDYQQFNQYLKEESIVFVKKLLKKFTDKRGKDYQDIKKFVIPTFQDMGFMKEKEVLELFKTRRKRRAPSK